MVKNTEALVEGSQPDLGSKHWSPLHATSTSGLGNIQGLNHRCGNPFEEMNQPYASNRAITFPLQLLLALQGPSTVLREYDKKVRSPQFMQSLASAIKE